MKFEHGLDRGINEKFGLSIAGDFVRFVKHGSGEVGGVLDAEKSEAGLLCRESDLAMSLVADLDLGELDQLEMASIR